MPRKPINSSQRDGNSWIPLFVDCRKHTGWIWTIVSSGHSLLTGSWDGTLLQWALSSSGLQLQTAYKLSAQVLCSAFMDPHTVAVGANHWVHIIDIRAPPLSQTGIRLLHKKAVLCMDCRNSGSPAALPYDTGTWNWGGFPASGDCISSCNESLSDLSSIGASLEDLPSLLGLIEIDPDVQPEESSGDKPSVSLDPSMPNTVPSLPSEGPCVSSVVSSAISLFTGSNDRTLSGWDLRNPSKAVKSYQFSNYPRKMSLMDDDELWVAEPPGRIHVFDVREGRLDCVHVSFTAVALSFIQLPLSSHAICAPILYPMNPKQIVNRTPLLLYSGDDSLSG
ncbi:unnamed protein product [Dicrocoelium dendriticum]|nr:unnamed protein product [Dicrocoelium dendriticum]